MISPRRAGRQERESAGDHGKAWPPLHTPGHTHADRDLNTHMHVPGPANKNTVYEYPAWSTDASISTCVLTKQNPVHSAHRPQWEVHMCTYPRHLPALYHVSTLPPKWPLWGSQSWQQMGEPRPSITRGSRLTLGLGLCNVFRVGTWDHGLMTSTQAILARGS